MNKLIKGNLVMNNVNDKDVNMYVKAGWKIAKTSKVKHKEVKQKLEHENDSNSEIVKE